MNLTNYPDAVADTAYVDKSSFILPVEHSPLAHMHMQRSAEADKFRRRGRVESARAGVVSTWRVRTGRTVRIQLEVV